MADQPFKIRRSPALAALAYGAVATLWILASDSLLKLVVSDPGRLSQLQSMKGLAFVAVTTAILYILLRTASRESPPSLRETSPKAAGTELLLPLAAYLLLSLALGLTGYFAFYQHRTQMKNNIERNLSAVAQLKVNQITWWLKERTADAQSMAGNSFFAQQAARWMAAPTVEAERRIRARLVTTQEKYGYQNVLLFDREARLLLAAVQEPGIPTGEDRELASQAMESGQVITSDLHLAGQGETARRLDFVAPLAVQDDGGERIVGAILLRVDPRSFLYPLIQSWPAASATAETLLVRREGDDVLFLNELRHRSGSAFTLRLPVSRPDLPAAMAVRGKEGVAEGIDYRGVPVLAAMRHIPDTPWFVVAKIDQAEVYAPITALAWAEAGMLAVFTIATGVVLFLWWRQQSLRQAFARYRVEQERVALLQHVDFLSKYANDIIILADEAGRIVEANDRSAEAYGYPREELIGLDVRQLRAPEARPAFEADWRELDEKDGRVYETLHQRKDGTIFPVEISARIIETDGRRFRQTIIREITERKAAESRLQQQLDELLRFQKLTVGRELRMKELTEENRRFREQLAETLKSGPPR